jgi:hypothetical protein
MKLTLQKINLQRLEQMANRPATEWTVEDYRMAHNHLTFHLGWSMSELSVIFWELVNVSSVFIHQQLRYLNPATGGACTAPGAIKYLVASMGNPPKIKKVKRASR